MHFGACLTWFSFGFPSVIGVSEPTVDHRRPTTLVTSSARRRLPVQTVPPGHGLGIPVGRLIPFALSVMEGPFLGW